MRIGELARTARVNVQTLRFYEREGLLAKPPRTRAGYRDYDRKDIYRVQFIRSCQDIGFTLKDVREVLDLHRVLASPDRALAMKPAAQERFLKAAARRLTLIDEKLAVLERMRSDMSALVATLKGRGKPVCPVSGVRVA
jgi:MerR family copper efflux transcriptional regulator